MLLNEFSPVTGAASPNPIGVADGRKNQHERAPRVDVVGGEALPVGQAGGEWKKGVHPWRAVRDDRLVLQVRGSRPPRLPSSIPAQRFADQMAGKIQRFSRQ